MIVFHGSIMEIENPDCNAGRDNLDFGKGFYLTTYRIQAEEWARKTAKDKEVESPIVNIYEFNKADATRETKYRIFSSYDEDWLEFIVANRRGQKAWMGYDIIEGGVANDRVIDTVRLYSYGYVSKEHALGELSKHQPNNQICILSQEALQKYLRFKEAIRL